MSFTRKQRSKFQIYEREEIEGKRVVNSFGKSVTILYLGD